MTDLTPERLAELKALEKAATPGPWVTRFDGAVYREVVRGEVPVCEHASREEAALIAALRNAAPALIAAAEERDELRNRLVEMEQSYVQVRNGNTALRDDNAAQRALLVRAGEAMADASYTSKWARSVIGDTNS